MTSVDEDDVNQSARDLVARRGARGAIDTLDERIRMLRNAGHNRALDTAYRILSAVERILERAER